jgi:hypothetical protein
MRAGQGRCWQPRSTMSTSNMFWACDSPQGSCESLCPRRSERVVFHGDGCTHRFPLDVNERSHRRPAIVNGTPTARLALKHGQPMPQRGILCLKSYLDLKREATGFKKRNISATIVADD